MRDPAAVAVVVERGDQHLQRRVGVGVRRGDVVAGSPRRAAAGRSPGASGVVPAHAVAGDGVDDREVELLVVGREVEEEVLRQSRRPRRARALGAVDLVDDDDRSQAERERLAQDEPRLRHRPFDRVDQQQAAVGHVQHALDLAAEVGVAGRVDDVDLDAVVDDRACSWPGW